MSGPSEYAKDFRDETLALYRAKIEADAEFGRRFALAQEQYRREPRYRRSVYGAATQIHAELETVLPFDALDPDERSELATKLALVSRVVFDFYVERDAGRRDMPHPPLTRF